MPSRFCNGLYNREFVLDLMAQHIHEYSDWFT